MGNELTLTQKSFELTTTDPAAIAAAEAAKQRIQAAYQVALYKPRDIEQARINILKHCQRPGFAEKAEYSKPVGKTKITGASIRFAEMALREWGNVISEPQIVYEDENYRRVRVIITDLETNTSFAKEIQVKKTVERKNSQGREVVGERINSFGDTVYIVKATEDELLNKEAAMISKAIRNEGLRLIPEDIIEEALDACRKTLLNRDAKDPEGAKRKMLDAFAIIGVMPKDIEQYLQHPVAQLTPHEIQELRTIYQSIVQGESKWNDYVAQDTEVVTEKSSLELLPDGENPKKKTKTRQKISKLVKALEGKGITEQNIKDYCEDNNLPFNEDAILNNLDVVIGQVKDWKNNVK